MRLLHFADLHLGVENYGRVDPSTGLHSRLADFSRCLEFVVDTAIGEQVDLVLFAGDAYRNCNPNPTWQRELASHLRRLHDAGIPVAMVVGNHDTPAAYGRATSVDIFKAIGLDGMHVMRRPQLLRLTTKSGPLQLAGLPWPTRHYLRADDRFKSLSPASMNRQIAQICAAQIAAFATQLDPALPSVLAAHVALAEASYSGTERTALIGDDPVLTKAAFTASGFDYVALGHIHRHQDVNGGNMPPVVYSGSVERVDFGEAGEEKGFCIVDLAAEGQTTYRFVPTPARRFVTLEVDATDAEDPTAAVLAALESVDVSDAVLRVTCSLEEGSGVRLDSTRIRTALAAAYHVASITPRYAENAGPQRRASLSEEAGVGEALDRYLDNHPSLQDERGALSEYANRLERELALIDSGEGPQP